jgi:hypothetical protein
MTSYDVTTFFFWKEKDSNLLKNDSRHSREYKSYDVIHVNTTVIMPSRCENEKKKFEICFYGNFVSENKINYLK